jgi:hypothetical protein
MVALTLRLARRAGETASLSPEDIDWRLGMLSGRGKEDRLNRVPFPADAGGRWPDTCAPGARPGRHTGECSWPWMLRTGR